jgi:hypothetical protein
MMFKRPTTPNGAGVHANRERRCGRLVLPGSNCYLIEISKQTVALFDHRLAMLITRRCRPPLLGHRAVNKARTLASGPLFVALCGETRPQNAEIGALFVALCGEARHLISLMGGGCRFSAQSHE